MKNTIKMSLVAALAVAGLSQTASAGSLEEAIKGVSLSGKMEVEYDYTDSKTNTATRATTTNTWDYDLDFTVKVPVNDNVTAVVTAQADTTDDVQNDAVTSNNNDSDVNLAKMYFQYSNGPVTAMVGKQGMAGAPWFDDERASGVVAMYNAGVATLAAAHFTGNNSGASAAIANSDITAAAVIGKIGPVNASLWYAQLQGLTATQDADSYSINVNGSFDIVNIDVTYTDTDYDIVGGTNDDAELLKAVVSANLEAATVFAGYGQTGKHNEDSTAGVDLTSDSDAATNMKLEQLALDDLNDADAFLIGVSVPVDAWTFGLTYLDGEYNAGATATAAYNETANAKYDFDETLVTAKYQMSKNMKVTGFYSTAEIANLDTDSASLALEYKF